MSAPTSSVASPIDISFSDLHRNLQPMIGPSDMLDEKHVRLPDLLNDVPIILDARIDLARGALDQHCPASYLLIRMKSAITESGSNTGRFSVHPPETRLAA
jgi:hypothetical protein